MHIYERNLFTNLNKKTVVTPASQRILFKLTLLNILVSFTDVNGILHIRTAEIIFTVNYTEAFHDA